MIGNTLMVYLDDIIMSKDMPSHLQSLEQVLQKLTKVNLKIKLSKCAFMKKIKR